ncbi:uncharacterized protein LOC122038038 [Zingiber officinale]|uniref:uncharacterized protein LOC122038038 n=1 Tax=Zingiber officinale TaxID=94328 RepID=UPI001C4C0207|nr:uncharacterized protein LOC122038038 [Zingiber officinale]
MYSQQNEKVSKVVNQNALGNNQMISPAIQKDLMCACASEITLSIIEDIGNNVFSLMIDESRDISVKEQIGVVLRYVNKRGQVIERFLAIVHVSDTSSHSLKDAVDALFVKHGLSLSRLRGQGYDGASNMQGEFNGLKSLVLQENPYARNSFDFVIYILRTSQQMIDPNFFGIEDLGSFAQKIVETLKNQAYPLVYHLIEMTLVLPVATASVEIVFSAMKMIKTDLRNRMGDEWMNDSLVV